MTTPPYLHAARGVRSHAARGVRSHAARGVRSHAARGVRSYGGPIKGLAHMTCQIIARWLVATLIAAHNGNQPVERLNEVISRPWTDKAFPIHGWHLAGLPPGIAKKCLHVIEEEVVEVERKDLLIEAQTLFMAVYAHAMVMGTVLGGVGYHEGDTPSSLGDILGGK